MADMQRIEELKAKHANLEHLIEEENTRPLPDDGRIADLKRQKLRIKDEIVKLTHH